MYRVTMDEKTGKYGILAGHTRVVVPAKYDYIRMYEHYYHEGSKNLCERFACVKMGDKFGMIEVESGKEILPCVYENISLVRREGKEVVVCARDESGKEGILDLKTGEQLLPFNYDEIVDYSITGNFAIVKNVEGQTALVKAITEEEIIPYREYDEALLTVKNFVTVRKDNNYGLLGLDGKICMPTSYNDEPVFIHGTKNLFYVLKNGGYGVFDALSQQEVVPCEYNPGEIEVYENLDCIMVNKNGKNGLISISENRQIIPCEYDDIYVSDYPHNVPIRVKNGDKIGKYTHEGEMIVPCLYTDEEFYTDPSDLKSEDFESVEEIQQLIKYRVDVSTYTVKQRVKTAKTKDAVSRLIEDYQEFMKICVKEQARLVEEKLAKPKAIQGLEDAKDEALNLINSLSGQINVDGGLNV